MKKVRAAFVAAVALGLSAAADPLADTNALVWTEGTALPMEGRGFADTPTPYSRIGKSHVARIEKANWGVVYHAGNSAGLSFRFATDAAQLTFRWSLTCAALNCADLSNIGHSGLDVYERAPGGEWKFVNWRFIMPRNYPMQQTGNFYTISWTPGNECWVYLPSYNGISDFAVGIEKGKRILPVAPRKSGIAKPVVFYGSSITHGAAASRPGLAYPSVAGRRGDFPIVNLGFSGCAHMEPEVGDMVAAVDASCYVLDPLGNMWVGEINERYEKFVRRLAAARPGVPIVLASFCADHAWTQGREAAVKAVFDKLTQESAAFARTLTFIPTSELVTRDLDEATVDGCHPTDDAMLQIGNALAGRLPAIIRRAQGRQAPVDVGNDLQVLWDDFVVDAEKTTATRVLHHPEYAGDVMLHDKPWEGDGSDYHCIFKDGDVYRMYYNGVAIGITRKQPYPYSADGVRICYAESKDGVRWTKPNLGLREFRGSKENNIVLDRTDSERGWDNCFVFRDPNPACPKDELYKAVGSYERRAKEGEACPANMTLLKASVIDDGIKRDNVPFFRCLALFTSPDPFHFKFNRPITGAGAFDTLNTMVWDRHTKQYFCYCRGYHGVKEERNGDLNVRDVMVTTSKDAVTWTKPKLLDFGEGAEDYALYTNLIQPYFRNDRLFVGFPTRYVERKEWTKNFDRLPGTAERKERSTKWGAHCKRYGLTTSDCIFIMSRDGKTFQRDDEAFIRPGPQGSRNWVYGDCYPAYGLVPVPGDEGAQEELSIYQYTGHWMGATETLKRYRIRQDGFVSRQAPYAGARVVTKPMAFAKGRELLINFSTSARGRLFVTVRDDSGRSLRSIELFGDEVDRVVDFGKDELATFAGKPVTLEFEMSDSDIYSFRFK